MNFFKPFLSDYYLLSDMLVKEMNESPDLFRNTVRISGCFWSSIIHLT